MRRILAATLIACAMVRADARQLPPSAAPQQQPPIGDWLNYGG